MKTHVLIAGGGLAGLAAAAALAPRGFRVTLLESRPRWGGRASSFTDQTSGETIDNCQHVSMGCCTNFAWFVKTLGVGHLFQREPKLWFIAADGHINTLAASPLPAPLHLLPAFGRLSYLTPGDKLALARGLRSLAKARVPETDHETMAGWLSRHHQPQRVIERFWHVVLVSALSESLDRINVTHAKKVFCDGFLNHRRGWEVYTPREPLHRLYGSELQTWFAGHKTELRLQAGVKRLEFEDGRAARATLRSGEHISADEFILALPQHLVADVLPATAAAHEVVQNLARIETAPISSVHLWVDRPIMSLPHAVLIDRLSQWVFDKSAGDDNGTRVYQVVISAAREIEGRSQDELARQVWSELQATFPLANAARLIRARTVTEHRAALSMLPGIDSLRPAQQSPWPNVQFAGDWTRTGWPSTMEGAVRSGLLAAENLLRNQSRPEKLVQPDLPQSWLTRLTLG